MEDAIERKLRRELSSIEPMTEARVVYILAEIRKLIERTNQKRQYFALDFHCSWALHATMDRAGAERILRRFDEAYELLKDKRLDELPRSFADDFEATAGLENFRTSLGAFLAAYSLPTKVVGNEWTAFMCQYAAVIEDCPLTIKDTATPLQNITHVTVHIDEAQKEIAGAGQSYKLFRIRWVSHGKNNKQGVFETYSTIS